MSLTALDRSRAAWWTVGLVLALAVCFVVYSFVGTVVFGVFIYYATRPIYRRLSKRIQPPSLAAAVAIFALALPALLLMGYALLIGVRELEKLTVDATFDLTQYPGVDEVLLERIADPATLLSTGLSEYVTFASIGAAVGWLSQATGTLAFFGIGAIHVFVMIAIAFYLLRDDHRLSRWAVTRFSDDQGVLEEYLRAVDRDFNSIFFGNILNAVLTGTIGVIVYTLLNAVAPPGVRIPAAALVGLFAGVASLIPVVGMKLVYVPVTLYMALVALVGGQAEALWFVVLFAAVSFVVVDTIPDLVLRPYVSGRGLHVGAVMIAYTFGPLLFGWYGIFLLPMLLVLTVHFGRLILPELVRGTPIQPYSVDPGYFIDPAPSSVDTAANGGSVTGDFAAANDPAETNDPEPSERDAGSDGAVGDDDR